MILSTLASRVMAVLVTGIVLVQLLGLGLYDYERRHLLNDDAEDRIAGRLAAAIRLSSSFGNDQRKTLVAALSDDAVTVDWSALPLVAVQQDTDPPGQEVAREIAEWLRPAPGDLRVASKTVLAGKGREISVSIRLKDASWINVNQASLPEDRFDFTRLILSTSTTATVVILLSLLVVRWLTRPLRRLANAAHRLGTHLDGEPLAPEGPMEVAHVTIAFNLMQKRLLRLIADRTEMFAAISHDMKTPLTRLKLRAELADDETRTKMLRDLDEMEAMIGSFISFLRDESDTGESRLIDLAALLHTIADNYADAGAAVSCAAQKYQLECRPLSLKRAVANLVDNAVKYAGAAEIALRCEDGRIAITIADRGPGIAADMREAIFRPFYRLETSRNRDTGGTGLGLAVARTIARAHGGDIFLAERPGGGLLAIMRLPVIGDVQ